MVDSLDVMKGAQMVSGLAPGAVGQSASVVLSAPVAIMEENKRRAELAKELSKGNLESLAANNPALKRQLDELNKKTVDSIRNSAVSAGGAGLGALTGGVIGGAIATFAIPIPVVGTITGKTVGAFIGSIVGGFGASYVDSAVFTTQSNNAFAIKANIEADLKQGVPVSDVKMFALLASSLPDTQLNELNKSLEKMTGGKVKTVEQAIVEGKRAELEKLMNDPGTDILLGADTGLNPMEGTTVSAQFAQMVNNGMDVNFLMRRDWRDRIVQRMNENAVGMGYAQGVDVQEPNVNPLPTLEHEAGRRTPNHHRRGNKDPVLG